MSTPLSICRFAAAPEAAVALSLAARDRAALPPALDDRWRVLKFGGTSVATPERLQVVREQVTASAATRRIALVVSALAGVTDTLAALIVRAVSGDAEPAAPIAALRARHLDLLAAVVAQSESVAAECSVRAVCRQLTTQLQAVRVAGAADASVRASILACGERLSAPIVAALLQQSLTAVEVCEPTRLLRASGFALEAEADLAATAAAVQRWVRQTRARIAVIGGFYAADAASGALVLLGRGGSDTSATLLGEALAADRVEIWTDVDGVLSADPRLLREARVLPQLGYAQAASMAAHGARVLHARSIAPVARAGIPLHVRNTQDPAAPGTVIGPLPLTAVHALAAPAANDGVATVAVVGPGLASSADAQQRVRQVLAAHALLPIDVAHGVDEHAVVATVPAAQREAAVRALHAAWSQPLERIDLLLAGARGQVGSALRVLLAREAAAIAARTRLDLRLRAAFDRRGFAESASGLAPGDIHTALQPRTADDWSRLRRGVRDAGRPTVFIDCTASETITDEYAGLLADGIGVASANKRAGAGDAERWRKLVALDGALAPWRRETTVGAALPLLSTLRALALRGERVLSMEGVLSGSLSYILNRLHEGGAFSAAVREARARGYTEPDPREDLAAVDLTRKLVILAREAGATLDAADVVVEPLVDMARWSPDGIDPAADAHWRARAEEADAQGRRLVAIAAWDARGAWVGVRAEPLASPLARVRAGENLLRIHSEFHAALPLLIAGPGAGPEVTAAGVLSDVIAAACELTARRR